MEYLLKLANTKIIRNSNTYIYEIWDFFNAEELAIKQATEHSDPIKLFISALDTHHMSNRIHGSTRRADACTYECRIDLSATPIIEALLKRHDVESWLDSIVFDDEIVTSIMSATVELKRVFVKSNETVWNKMKAKLADSSYNGKFYARSIEKECTDL